jgi:hypothetical protein
MWLEVDLPDPGIPAIAIINGVSLEDFDAIRCLISDEMDRSHVQIACSEFILGQI